MRCAIYTRKSTEEGLDQDYNSLDAQRDAAESFTARRGGRGGGDLEERQLFVPVPRIHVGPTEPPDDDMIWIDTSEFV
jgi:hypothetical protein